MYSILFYFFDAAFRWNSKPGKEKTEERKSEGTLFNMSSLSSAGALI